MAKKVSKWFRIGVEGVCTTDEGRKKGYRFQMDLNDGDSVDISISLQLTERTLVREESGALHVSYAPEPPLPKPVTRQTELYINGELVSKWDE